jgi:serine phosphatase RsbU (regulator of sigma subunit)/anti-sigma regulatory factor (Ser/Thr protein kinase)
MINWIRERLFSFTPRRAEPAASAPGGGAPVDAAEIHHFEIAPHDPLLPVLLDARGVLDVRNLNLDSPTLDALKEQGVTITVPLISQGDLVGLLNLGPRLSEQDYSADDRRLLGNLATQAAPALRVAQLARQQQAEARERERIEQELRVASLIQHTLLPKENPKLPGWEIESYYQPARAVGGDFYDFLELATGEFAIVVGDVTDKGVPAAMVMATTRGILRAAAERLETPGKVLQRVNDVLCPDIPPNMFVTCLYMLLEPETGAIRFANAGHNLPLRKNESDVLELRATGMPLGLMPGMVYEEHETQLAPNESLLLYSDGLVEAHNPKREMFGFPRLRNHMETLAMDAPIIPSLCRSLERFTGTGWDQEDDVTYVTLHRGAQVKQEPASPGSGGVQKGSWQTISTFQVASAPGNERRAIEEVTKAIQVIDLPKRAHERLKTAVAEGTMNAMEHGNRYDPDLPVDITVKTSGEQIAILISDHGGAARLDVLDPDLDAKIAGDQSPRGWGLYLIKNMVDEMHTFVENERHILDLRFNLKGGADDGSR